MVAIAPIIHRFVTFKNAVLISTIVGGGLVTNHYVNKPNKPDATVIEQRGEVVDYFNLPQQELDKISQRVSKHETTWKAIKDSLNADKKLKDAYKIGFVNGFEFGKKFANDSIANAQKLAVKFSNQKTKTALKLLKR